MGTKKYRASPGKAGRERLDRKIRRDHASLNRAEVVV